MRVDHWLVARLVNAKSAGHERELEHFAWFLDQCRDVLERSAEGRNAPIERNNLVACSCFRRRPRISKQLLDVVKAFEEGVVELRPAAFGTWFPWREVAAQARASAALAFGRRHRSLAYQRASGCHENPISINSRARI